jgi:hypothetical protein
MKRLKYIILKWLGFIVYPNIVVNGFFGHGCNYNRIVVWMACDTFLRQWKIHYNQDIEYLFHGLTIDFESEPIKNNDGSNNYGIAYIDRVKVWKNSQNLCETAFVHELIHYVKRSLTGDPDIKHAGREWGENFESPVKRLIKAEGL